MKTESRVGKYIRRVLCLILSVGIVMAIALIPSWHRLKEDPVEKYMDRTFTILLGREASNADIQLWYPNLAKGNCGAAYLIDSVLHSDEFSTRALSAEQQIDVMYQAMIDRLPDASEKDRWMTALDEGGSLTRLEQELSQSIEFQSFCAGYEIQPGTVNVTEVRDLHPDVARAVVVLFRDMLGRDPEPAELNEDCGKLVDFEITVADYIRNIYTGAEFAGRQFDPESSMQTLLTGMLVREVSQEEVEKYAAILEQGVSLDYLFHAICEETDFQNTWKQIGLLPGTVTLTQPRDMHYELTGFISRFYAKLSGRTATEQELNEGIGKILSGEQTVPDMLGGVLDSEESQTLLSSNEDFINAIYEVLYGTVPAPEEIQGYLNGLNNGITRSRVLQEIMDDSAFAAKMAEYGIDVSVEKVVPEKMVALTFDDGPYDPYTFRILDSLETYGGHATFFVVGNRIDKNRASIIRALNLGCEIGNHTWNHTNLTKISGQAVAEQMQNTDDALFALTGFTTKVMRPVGGAFNDTVAANVGKPMIIWCVDTNDWKYKDTQHIVDEILNNVKDGDIILMHDIYETTAAAAEIVIPALIEQGYTLVTVSELAEYKGIELQPGSSYRSIRG